MSKKKILVLAMIGAALAVGSVIYFYTQSYRIAFGVAGVLLLLDLTIVPKLLPHIFNKKDDE